MKWQKLGRIFIPDNQYKWMRTHAALPIPLNINANVYRIFFSTRDQWNRSYGAYVDIDIPNFSKILNMSSYPVLSPGAHGLFDDCGVSLSSYNEINNYFYYLGWNLTSTVPFKNTIGLAILKQKNLCKRIRKTPIIQICEQEPYSFGYPFVLYKNGYFKMWYDTNMIWNLNKKYKYYFVLRTAKSIDGVNWDKEYINCISMNDGELAISRPCVIFDKDTYKMWYSINLRGKYRIGYAESVDGITWTRKDDEVGITVSTEGWDSDEIEYPYVSRSQICNISKNNG